MEKNQIIEQSHSSTSLADIDPRRIESLIHVVRNKQIMFDNDLAVLYQVDTGALNRSVKRNIDRFPEDFRFQLTKAEYETLRCQTGISKSDDSVDSRGGRRYMPFVFTEQGIAILIDNYVDIDTLNILSKKKVDVNVTVYTLNRTKITETDINIFNKQYPKLVVKYTESFHDRFMILDRKIAYHVGASIKDAGKKSFAISLLQDDTLVKEIINRIS